MDKMRRRYRKISPAKRAYIAGIKKGKRIGRAQARRRWR